MSVRVMLDGAAHRQRDRERDRARAPVWRRAPWVVGMAQSDERPCSVEDWARSAKHCGQTWLLEPTGNSSHTGRDLARTKCLRHSRDTKRALGSITGARGQRATTCLRADALAPSAHRRAS